jgi:hypothetical protein
MSTKPQKIDSIDRVSIGLAAVTALTGLVRVVHLPASEGLNDTTLKFFAVAGALLLLRKIKSLSFGDYKAEFQAIQDKADEAVEEANTATSMARNFGASVADDATAPKSRGLPGNAEDAELQKWEVLPGTVHDDPWKGRFENVAEARHRRLRAEVSPSLDDGWFRVHIWVESTDAVNHPLSGRARFFLHSTFPNSKTFVPVLDGRAELRLTAWGAFTVGVLCDEAQTKLELDLELDPSFPKLFRNR